MGKFVSLYLAIDGAELSTSIANCYQQIWSQPDWSYVKGNINNIFF